MNHSQSQTLTQGSDQDTQGDQLDTMSMSTDKQSASSLMTSNKFEVLQNQRVIKNEFYKAAQKFNFKWKNGIKYLREKPPNTQTLLDGLYIQMFCIWIFYIIVCAVCMIIVGLDIKVQLISFIIGNAVNIAMFLSAINLIMSCFYRIILINNPTLIEHLLDENILTYSM